MTVHMGNAQPPAKPGGAGGQGPSHQPLALTGGYDPTSFTLSTIWKCIIDRTGCPRPAEEGGQIMKKSRAQNKLNWYVSVGLAVCLTWLAVGFDYEYARGPGVIPASATELSGQADPFLAFDTAQDSLYWRISQFNAANLDPDIPNNHAWWCGSWFSISCPDDPPEGYGNNWDQWLVWDPFVVEDPTQPVSLRVTARLNHDSEIVFAMHDFFVVLFMIPI